jgi:phytanoyl-CoA hydroxylase
MNRTKGYRKAISCHYASSQCYMVSIKNTSQEHLAEEIVDTYRNKLERLGVKNVDQIPKDVRLQMYCDMWKSKSRLCCGEQGTF